MQSASWISCERRTPSPAHRPQDRRAVGCNLSQTLQPSQTRQAGHGRCRWLGPSGAGARFSAAQGGAGIGGHRVVDRRAIPDVAILPERHEESGAELDWSFHWEMGNREPTGMSMHR
jgi:hypothetical protein